MPSTTLLAAPAPPAVTRESCWPTEQEFLLLQAGLLAKAPALAAWNQFCNSITDIEALDGGCYRLFPLVAANLQDAGPLPHFSRLMGVLRHSWARNQRLFAALLPALRALPAAGIPFLFLKGVALSGIYRELGSVRPMDDIDILIRPHDLPATVARLERVNCRPPQPVTTERLADLLRFRHELTLRLEDGSTLDVHWYLVSDSCDLQAEDEFWRGAIPCVFPEFTGSTLNHSDHFVHTCLHGAQWNEVSPVRWLADATILIRRGVDWKRVEGQAARLQQLGPVRETLLFLERLGVDLASEPVARWRGMPLSAIETLEERFRERPPNARERTRQLVWVYLRLSRHLGFWELLRRLPAFMRQIHHFRSYSRRVKFLAYLAYQLCRGEGRGV